MSSETAAGSDGESAPITARDKEGLNSASVQRERDKVHQGERHVRARITAVWLLNKLFNDYRCARDLCFLILHLY